MADAGDERQRHRVGDVGADDARSRQLCIEQHHGSDAEGAGADRGDRHHHAESCADQNRQRRLAPPVERPDTRCPEGKDSLAEHQHRSGCGECPAEHARDQALRHAAVDAEA